MDFYNELSCDIFELVSPIGASTSTTIALRWNKGKNYSCIKHYIIKLVKNGVTIQQYESRVTDYTLEGLDDNTNYQVQVIAIAEDGMVLHTSNVIEVKTKEKPKQYDITSYGAFGDATTLNTAAIQKAIDDCNHNGMVYIPKGTYVSGAIYLKSNMTLHLEEGAKLLGSSDIKDYPIMHYRFEGLETSCYASLINTIEVKDGQSLENITISGKGCIDASGALLRKQETKELKGKPGRAVCLRNVENVYLYGITVRQSPAWCVHLIYCENICVNQVSIHSKYDENGVKYQDICNGDGLTIDSSKNSYVFHSMISSQDDCISIKSGKNEEGREVGIPTENLRISNCVFKSGFGIAYGSEMSGGLKNIILEDCTFENTYSIASLKSPRGRGGIIEEILCRDNTHYNHSLEHTDCKWFRGALLIDEFYSHDNFNVMEKEEINEGTSLIRDIYFENMTLETVAGNAIYLTGLAERPLERIYLKNIKAKGKYGFKANNIVELKLEGVEVTSSDNEDYIMRGVTLC